MGCGRRLSTYGNSAESGELDPVETDERYRQRQSRAKPECSFLLRAMNSGESISRLLNALRKPTCHSDPLPHQLHCETQVNQIELKNTGS